MSFERVTIRGDEANIDSSALESVASYGTENSEFAPAPSESNPITQTEARPSWLPNQFLNPEALVQAWATAQKKITEQAQQLKQLSVQTTTAPTHNLPGSQAVALGDGLTSASDQTEDDKNQPLENSSVVGLTDQFIDQCGQEYLNQGQLSEDSLKRLQAAGIPASLVDTHLKALNGFVEHRTQKVMGVFGGETIFNQVADWARAHLTPAQIQQWDQRFESIETQVAVQAAQELLQLYKSKMGQESEPLQGYSEGPSSGYYRSYTDLIADMNQPLYRQMTPEGQAFRHQVEQKLMASDLLKQVRDVGRAMSQGERL